MRISLVIAALAAALLNAAPAAADAPAPGFGRQPAAHRPHWAPPARRYGYGAPRRGHFGYGAPHRRHFGYAPVGPGLGPLPPFFVGTGDAAAHLQGEPVGLTLYREAYIGRGLLSNTPPTLDRPGPLFGGRY